MPVPRYWHRYLPFISRKVRNTEAETLYLMLNNFVGIEGKLLCQYHSTGIKALIIYKQFKNCSVWCIIWHKMTYSINLKLMLSYFMSNHKYTLPSLFEMLKLLVSSYTIFVLRNITTFNTHTLLPQYMIKIFSTID